MTDQTTGPADRGSTPRPRTSPSRSPTRSRASCSRCGRSPARPTAAGRSRCCCSRSARCCSPAPGWARSATSRPRAEYQPDVGPEPDLDEMRLRLADDARRRRHLQLRLRPLRPRGGREPALRRPDQHRHRPRERPAPLPRSATSTRRCGGGSSPTSPPGATWPAPRSTRCCRWSPTTGSTPSSTDEERAGRGGRGRCWTATSRGPVDSVDSAAGPSPSRAEPRAQEESGGHCRAEVRRLLGRRRRPASSGSPSASSTPARPGHDVVVVVSAMGDTTDELRDLAEQVTPLPPPRELDMLLTAGERISMALLAMAIAQLGHKAQSFTGSQAGVITDSAHGKAKIIDITPGPDRAARSTTARSRSSPASRASRQDTKDITTLGRGALRHHGGRAGRRAGRRGLRDLHRRRRRLHRRPADRARPPASSTAVSYRGDAGDGRLAAPRSCTCGASSTPAATTCPIHVRSSFSPEGGHLDHPGQPAGDEQHGTGDHRRRRPRPQRGQDHRRRRARQGRRGGPDLRGAGRRRDQHRHGRAERLGRRDRPHRHLLHAAARRRPDRDGRAGADPGRGRLRQAALRRPDRQGLADRRRHALPPGHHREVLRRARRRPASTSR